MEEIRRSKKSKGISRRKFLEKTATITVGIAFVQVPGGLKMEEQQTGKWPADAGKVQVSHDRSWHILILSGYGPGQEGVAVVHSTFRSALDRMNETPEFAFTSSSAQFYRVGCRK